MKTLDFNSGRVILLGAATVLALGAARPAFAGLSDNDFAAAFGSLWTAVAHETGTMKKNLFRRVTQETGPSDPLLVMQSPLLNLVKKIEPSIVYLIMEIPEDEKAQHKNGNATCTGFFADSSRYLDRESIITTNSHCVEKLKVGDEIAIGLYDGNDIRPKMTKGKILAYGDSKAAKDIAFVEVNDTSLNRPPLPLWWKLDVGEQIVAVGNPLGFTFTVTRGIISALGRDNLQGQFVLEMNQSDVAINPGSSGGPMFNMWGSVVGINSQIASQSGGFEGIGLSVPANYIVEAMKQYRRTGNLKIGALQIEYGIKKDTDTLKNTDVDKGAKATVISVVPGGPADAAHIKVKDQLVRIDGIDLEGLAPAQAQKVFLGHVKYMSPGEKTVIVVRRDGQEFTLEATLGERTAPKPERPAWAPIPPKPAPGSGKTSYETVSL